MIITRERFKELGLGCDYITRLGCECYCKDCDMDCMTQYDIAPCVDEDRLKMEMTEDEYDAYRHNRLEVKGKDWNKGDRGEYNGEKYTVTETDYEWVKNDYIPVKLSIAGDNGDIRNIKPEELLDSLSFFNEQDEWGSGYSRCKVYGMTRDELLGTLANYQFRGDHELSDFVNGQQECDGALTFDVAGMLPGDVVGMLNKPGVFVFASWHWDYDIFDCSDYEECDVEFTYGPEAGDELGTFYADIKITMNGKYVFETGAGDYTTDDIRAYDDLIR